MVRPPPLDTLTRIYDLEELSAHTSPVAVVDVDFVIHWVNTAWKRFAHDNGAPEVAQRYGVGASYLDGIDEPLRSYYRSLFTNVLVTGDVFEHVYECSSPSAKRCYQARIVPLESDGLFLEHSLVREETHDDEPVDPLDEEYRTDDGSILQCANCRRVRRLTGEWDWVPRWVATMPFRTSHGLCMPCAHRYFHQAMKTRKGNGT